MIVIPEISPNIVVFSIFGVEFALRWYAMAYIFGILIAWGLARATLKRPILWPKKTAPLTPANWEDLLTYLVIGVVVGGRLGYVILYQPSYYLQNPLDIVQVWQGGMAFHGGFLGVVAAAFIYCRKYNLPLLGTADLLALCTPAGLFLGRCANFINAELWGRPTEMPWGVAFAGAAAQACDQIGGLCARHPSQLYEALLEGLFLGLALLWLAYRRGALRQPGKITSIFCIGYGLSRFVVEFFRQPDSQFVSSESPIGLAFQVGGIGLTMGQLLSLPMIIIGVVLWYKVQQDD